MPSFAIDKIFIIKIIGTGRNSDLNLIELFQSSKNISINSHFCFLLKILNALCDGRWNYQNVKMPTTSLNI